MKRVLYVMVVCTIIITVFSSCKTAEERINGQNKNSIDMKEEDNNDIKMKEDNKKTLQEGSKVLHSLSEDVDGDGKLEKIEIIQVNSENESDTGAIEGWLRVTDGSDIHNYTFNRKSPNSLTGIFSGVEIKDLDRDGTEDIFIILSEAANPFTLNHFFMYSHKLKKAFTYRIEGQLVKFAEGFKFYYKGNGLLEIRHKKYGFKGEMKLEQDNSKYNGSWVEPVSADMGKGSKLSLVEAETGDVEIKVVMPVYGLATVDVLGEVSLYYRVDKGFELEVARFEVFDHNNGVKEKIGESVI